MMRAVLLVAFAASVVAPPVGIHEYFSRVENKMSEGAAKILGATKTIAKHPLQPRPQVAGESAALAPLLAEAASAQSRENTTKNGGNMAETMGHAVAGAAKSSSSSTPDTRPPPLKFRKYEPGDREKVLVFGKPPIGPADQKDSTGRPPVCCALHLQAKVQRPKPKWSSAFGTGAMLGRGKK